MNAEDTFQRGDSQGADEPSPEATQIAPQDLQTWLMRAETAPSIEEAINCLNQVNAWLPPYPEAKPITYQIVQKLLKQDPFLLYLNETDDLYRVRNSNQLFLMVPKDRSIPEPYPAKELFGLQKAYRWLRIALFGLLLAGLGAMVFATLAAITAISVNFKPISKEDRLRSFVVIILSGGLWLLGLLLGVIFLVHLV
jgi:hypothetical protein